MNRISTLLLLCFFLCMGCIQDRAPDGLKVLYSPDSTYVIYEYVYYGAAFTSDRRGFRIGKADEPFSRKLRNLDMSFIHSWENENDLVLIKMTTSGIKSQTPRISRKRVLGIDVKTKEYTFTRSSSAKYRFEDVLISVDSISFNNLHKVWDSLNMQNDAFLKGPITVDNNRYGMINSISIRSAIPYENEMQSMTYIFEPKDTLYVSDFKSDRVFYSLYQ